MSSGSVTLDRMYRGEFAAYSPNLSGLAAVRNPTYTGFDGQSYRLPQSVGEQWSLSRNGPRLATSNHQGVYVIYHLALFADRHVSFTSLFLLCL